jgi:hypothetical protein
VAVEHDLTCIFGDIRGVNSASVHGDRVAIPGLVVYVPTLVIVLVFWVILHELRGRRQRRMMMQYPYPPPPPPPHL